MSVKDTKFAKQGIRQNAIPFVSGKTLLKPGDKIIALTIGKELSDTLVIPEGTIGCVHTDEVNKISINRDDCKAACKAIRAENAEEKRVSKNFTSKIELNKKVEEFFQPVVVSYTLKEKTLKQHTLKNVCDAAKEILKSKHNYDKLCVDLLKGKNESELLTTVEMSELVNKLVDDTLYWAGAYTSTGPLV